MSTNIKKLIVKMNAEGIPNNEILDKIKSVFTSKIFSPKVILSKINVVQ